MQHESLYVSPIFQIFNPTDSTSKSAWKHISILNPRIQKIKDHGEFKTNLEIKENELIKLNKWLRDQSCLSHKFPHTNLQTNISISHYKRRDQGELTKLPRGGKLPGMSSGILISRIFSVHITP
jgi:hypothetical protein